MVDHQISVFKTFVKQWQSTQDLPPAWSDQGSYLVNKNKFLNQGKAENGPKYS